jgi:hypothetical protein
MKKQYKESFGYPFIAILICSIAMWFLWLTISNIPEKQREQSTTNFFFTNVQLQENESYGSPLLFAKPSEKGFSANYNFKENFNIDFIPAQTPIFQSLKSDSLKTVTPYSENIVKKTISPNLVNIPGDNRNQKQVHKQISISENLKKLNFTVDMGNFTLNEMKKNRYAICTVLIPAKGTIEHIFFEKTNLTKEQLVQLNRAILSSKFDRPKEEEMGLIKFFFKNGD